jgi:hypothetical protein
VTEAIDETASGAPLAASGSDLPDGLLDLYRLAIEMADRISVRRGVANSFFLTLNTAVVGVLGAADVEWYLAAAGILLSVAWWFLLRSYRDLNRAKFRVILDLEKSMPAHIYADEWAHLQASHRAPGRAGEAAGSRLARFRELGVIERVVPAVFALVYVIELARQIAA